jgi:hypothetical protein
MVVGRGEEREQAETAASDPAIAWSTCRRLISRQRKHRAVRRPPFEVLPWRNTPFGGRKERMVSTSQRLDPPGVAATRKAGHGR